MRAPPAPAPEPDASAAADLLYVWRVTRFSSIAEFLSGTGGTPQSIGDSIADAVGRAHADNPAWHIYTRILDSQALRAVESMRSGARAPLLGVPVALKDNIDIAGELTSCGRRLGVGPAVASAAIVARLGALGAIIIGKTNLDTAALGATGRNPHFGRCHNPRFADRLSGGSSSGSAAAVAAGHALLGIGTDTLGSARIPAAFCGIAGFKPTPGRLPTAGVAPLCPRFDSVGLLAGSLTDITLVTEALFGQGAQDRSPGGTPGPGLRLAVLDDTALGDVANDVADGYRRCVGLLRVADDFHGSHAPRMDWSATARAGLWKVAHDFALRSAGGMPGYHALADIDGELGRLLARAAALPATHLAAGEALIAESSSQLRQSLIEADAVLTPTCPQGAPRMDEELAKNVAAFVAPANLAGLPAVAWTQRLGAELSLSLQLIGRPGGDVQVLALATRVQRLLDRAFATPSRSAKPPLAGPPLP
jgi:Asp-tRNA(Asn)/Glu-tRNA(Gln) amidotransferase A subunit family amidase